MKQFLLLLLLILSISIDAQQDTLSYVLVSDIVIDGNKTTKPSVIYRELTFSKGEKLLVSELDKHLESSRQNLQNTTLFNFVTVDVKSLENQINAVEVIIDVTERWYAWIYPYIAYADRNINAWYEADDIKRFSFGADMEYFNFFGLKHTLNLTFIAGYNQNYSISYDIPYITKKQNLGLKAGIGYKRDKESAYKTDHNKVIYFKDDEQFAKQNAYVLISPYYRFGHRNKLFVEFEYNNTLFHDSLAYLNEDFVNEQGSRFQYFTLSTIFKNDFREEHNYPLDGHYLELMIKKVGLGVFTTSPDFFYAKITADWYQPIKGRWYWASNITTRLSTDNDPLYFLNNGLGYKNDYVRSYELYVVDAVNFALMKNNLKFAIINPQTRYIPFVKNDRFGKIHFALYANVFFDCAYSWNMPLNPTSFLDNKFIFGSGVGIDFVTYYDKVFRFEYGVNDMGESGFFIHFVAPI